MHLQEKLSLPFAVPITFLLLFVPCIGFLFPNPLHSRSLLSLSKHYRIINLPIFSIFSFLTVPLIHFALLISTCSPYLSSNLPKVVDLSSLLLQLSGILFLSLFALLPPVHRFIPLLRLTFSPLTTLDLPLPLSVFWILTRHRVCLYSGSRFGLSAWMAELVSLCVLRASPTLS